MSDIEWPTPLTSGLDTQDALLLHVTYHYPYTDTEAEALGMAVIDAHCHQCDTTVRCTIPITTDPTQDHYPTDGISTQRRTFMRTHLHDAPLSAILIAILTEGGGVNP